VATYGSGAEMKKGDILNKINDTRIKNAHQFYKFIASCKVGEMLTVIVVVRFCFKVDFSVQISFKRDSATLSSTLQVGARNHSIEEVMLVEHAIKGFSSKASQDGSTKVR
jgi:PDZ domain-containing secreted protein